MSSLTYGRDDLMRLVFSDTFFADNPELQDLQTLCTSSKEAYYASAKKKNCGCGGDASLTFNCLDGVIARLEALKANNPAAIQALLEHVRQRYKQDVQRLTVYYRKSAESGLQKYVYQ